MTKMKKAYLIHGWGGNPNSEGWFSWLREECKKRDIELIIPAMPDTNSPKIDEWINKIEETVSLNYNQEVYFIGHSIGCQAIMRYLDKINKKINGIVFVAPWMKLDMNTIKKESKKVLDIAKPWVETPINFNKVKKLSGKIRGIFSDNDPYVPLSETKFFKEKLGAEIIIKENEGHFNNTDKIPEIIDFINKK